ncbi:uncharacterized protein LOC118463097 isoform X1 [Anopheles albimanus]|nr:uncharacterized protein LOC118463097 isoform X1 [Anopheles albimanus]
MFFSMGSSIRIMVFRIVNVASREKRTFTSGFTSKSSLDKGAPSQRIDSSIVPKYQDFQDINTTIILDVEDERLKFERKSIYSNIPNKFRGVNHPRAEEGVFDINDLITILKLNNAMNIFVCTIPKHIKYVDYMCVASGRNRKHMVGMAEAVKKTFKIKRHTSDPIPKIEGEINSDWMAMDLGNIAMHIFSPAVREQYDLESLWTVGSFYDRELNKPKEDLIQLFEKHAVYLNDLKSPNLRKQM